MYSCYIRKKIQISEIDLDLTLTFDLEMTLTPRVNMTLRKWFYVTQDAFLARDLALTFDL